MHRFVWAVGLAAIMTVAASAQPHPSARPGQPGAGPQSFHDGRTFNRLPQPNRWRGDPRSFNRNVWNGGRWYHGRHDGRLAWWWIVGPSWYYYSRPVYPYPSLYMPPGTAAGWWYWCDATQDYYPYTTYCPSGWRRTAPR